MHHNLWVLLELKQVLRRGSGNVSLPRMRPEDYEHEEGGYRRVEFDARYVYEISDTMREPLLIVFSEPERAGGYIGEAFANGEDVAVIEVTPREILHRVFRGDRNGLCAVDPVAFSALLAGQVELYEAMSIPVTIGELVTEYFPKR